MVRSKRSGSWILREAIFGSKGTTVPEYSGMSLGRAYFKVKIRAGSFAFSWSSERLNTTVRTSRPFRLNQEIHYSIVKMKTRRQAENEKVQREISTLFNKSDILNLNGAKVFSIVEYNGKLSIYNSCAGEDWPPSKTMLVRSVPPYSQRKQPNY